MIHSLSKILKNRLPIWKNEEYWKWFSSQHRDGYEWHHLLGRKYSDLFVVQIPIEDHKRIHTKGYNKDEFFELFIQSLLNIIRYINENGRSIQA